MTVLTSVASKADERKMVQSWIRQAGTGTYLESLWSPELVSAIEREISEDGNCDVYGSMLWMRDSLSTQLAEANKSASHFELSYRSQVDQVVELRREIERLAGENSKLDVSNANLRGDYVELLEERNQLLNDLGWKAREIIELKAKMYDLEHAK